MLSGMVAFANHVNSRVNTTNNGLTNRFYNAQPVKFVERGVKFFIYPNGEFEYVRLRSRINRRRNANIGFRNNRQFIPRAQRQFRRDFVRFDQFGRIKRVENVPIRYDQFGRVMRVGSVFMNYGRRGLLNQVGALDVRYSRQGRIINSFGAVHGNWNQRSFAYRNRN